MSLSALGERGLTVNLNGFGELPHHIKLVSKKATGVKIFLHIPGEAASESVWRGDRLSILVESFSDVHRGKDSGDSQEETSFRQITTWAETFLQVITNNATRKVNEHTDDQSRT